MRGAAAMIARPPLAAALLALLACLLPLARAGHGSGPRHPHSKPKHPEHAPSHSEHGASSRTHSMAEPPAADVSSTSSSASVDSGAPGEVARLKAELAAEREASKRQASDLETEREHSRQKAADLAAERAVTRKKGTDLAAALEELGRLRGDDESVRAQLETEQKQLEDEHRAAVAAQTAASEAGESVTAKNNEILTLNAQITSQGNEISTLKARVQELEEKDAAAVQAAEWKEKELQEARDKGTIALEAKSSEIATLKAQAAVAKEKADADLQAKIGEIATLTRRVEELDKNHKNAVAASEAKEQEKAALSGQIATLQTSVTAAQNDAREKGALHEDLRKEHLSTQSSLAATKAELSVWRTKHEELRNTHADLVKRYEDPSMEEFLRHRAIKIYEHDEVVAGAVNKTFKYIVPRLTIGSRQSVMFMNRTQATIQQQLEAAGVSPNQVVLVSGFLVYGFLLIPMCVSFWLLANVRAVMKLRPMLMFCHMYFFLACLIAAVVALVLWLDPLTSFYQEYYGVYLFTQAALSIGYMIYVVLQLQAYRQASDGPEKCVRIVQVGIEVVVGYVYYEVVWRRAMLDQPPVAVFEGTSLPRPWDLVLPYMVGVLGFGLLLRMEHRARVARGRPAKDDEDTITISVDVHTGASEKQA